MLASQRKTSKLMLKRAYRAIVWGIVPGYYICASNPCLAQVVPDGTLATQVNTSGNQNFKIEGGTQVGDNLFHSFSKLSVPPNGTASFQNSSGVRNIFSRVTGGQGSQIEGLVQAGGNANVFLLNPNGIFFGPQARLEIGGSFLATTAESIAFSDGAIFSATAPQIQPALTMSMPVGLQFGKSPGSIQSQAIETDVIDGGPPFPIAVDGLAVQTGQTLALVGGNIDVGEGALFAFGGHIELGSVENSALIGITPSSTGLRLTYEDVQNFGEIRLSKATLDTTGEPSGSIHLSGGRVSITNNSELVAFNDGSESGQDLKISASKSVHISGNSNLVTDTFFEGNAGDILIETQRLSLTDSFITGNTEGEGTGGSIFINASKLVEIIGDSQESQVGSEAFGPGNAGKIEVNTERLVLRNGGQILAATSFLATGNGGQIVVNATESIDILGQGKVPSSLLATTQEEASGNGGQIDINTERLNVRGGGQILVSARTGSTGRAGILTIDASESIVLSGQDSAFRSESDSPQAAGNIAINTNLISVHNGAQISVRGQGLGTAGDLNIVAASILLDNQSQLVAETESGDGGNVNLKLQESLLLRRNSMISTSGGTSQDIGDGGNINVEVPIIFAIPTENSDITTNAFTGSGGTVDITTDALLGIEFRPELTEFSDITANSESGPDGTVTINTPEIDPSEATVDLPLQIEIPKIAQNCSANGLTSASSFVYNGRGGLPYGPIGLRRYSTPWFDVRSPTSSTTQATQTRKQPKPTAQHQPPIEAQGWSWNDNGQLQLVASQSAEQYQAAVACATKAAG